MTRVGLLYGVHGEDAHGVDHIAARCPGAGNGLNLGDCAHIAPPDTGVIATVECSTASCFNPRYFAPIRSSSVAYRGLSGSARDVSTRSASAKPWPIVHRLG